MNNISQEFLRQIREFLFFIIINSNKKYPFIDKRIKDVENTWNSESHPTSKIWFFQLNCFHKFFQSFSTRICFCHLHHHGHNVEILKIAFKSFHFVKMEVVAQPILTKKITKALGELKHKNNFRLEIHFMCRFSTVGNFGEVEDLTALLILLFMSSLTYYISCSCQYNIW